MAEVTLEQLTFLTQFIHPEKTNIGAGGTFSDEAIAGMHGADVATFRMVKGRFEANARQAAADLLADESFAAQVDQLPFSPGATIVGLGDSITDDYQSWLEILRYLFELRRPRDGITFLNLGISGDTTGEVLKRILAVTAVSPQWVLCMIGTNDTWRQGMPDIKPNVSIEETQRNLLAIRQFVAHRSSARWVWMTPATVLPEKIAKHWHMSTLEFNLSHVNDDLLAIGRIMRGFTDPVVDLQALFGLPPRAELLLDDGLHPSLEGQCVMLRALVTKLVSFK